MSNNLKTTQAALLALELFHSTKNAREELGMPSLADPSRQRRPWRRIRASPYDGSSSDEFGEDQSGESDTHGGDGSEDVSMSRVYCSAAATSDPQAAPPETDRRGYASTVGPSIAVGSFANSVLPLETPLLGGVKPLSGSVAAHTEVPVHAVLSHVGPGSPHTSSSSVLDAELQEAANGGAPATNRTGVPPKKPAAGKAGKRPGFEV